LGFSSEFATIPNKELLEKSPLLTASKQWQICKDRATPHFENMENLLPDTNSSETNRVVPALDKLIQLSLITFSIFSMFSISVTQISFAIGALAWLLKVHLTRTWNELRGTLIGSAILCFCLACVLSITASVDWESSLGQLKKMIQFAIIFWIANTVKDEKHRELLIKVFIVAGVAAALNGLYPLLSLKSIWAYRITGTSSVPSTFGGILMMTGLVALGRFLFHKPKEYWVLGSLGIVSLCILFSLTRQAWLGFLIGAVYLVFFWNKKYLAIIPLLLTTLLFYSPQSIKYRMNTLSNLKDGALHQRIDLWKGGWKIFKDHPITGCGYKCVDSIHSQYPDPSGSIAHYQGMHSNIFQLLVDTGIVGLGAWLSIWAAYFIEILKRWRALPREKSQENATGIFMGVSAAVLAFLAGGFFESSVYDSEVSMLLYFLMGLSLTQTKETPRVTCDQLL
jgi:putative inorganic carbon (hco3(-)) transporter